MLPSASNGNDLTNPFFPPNTRNFFTKHIFSTFQNTINMQNRQQKLLILFTPRS
eukprot:UN21932